MSRARDIKQIITEQSAGGAEQRTLEHLADRLDSTLGPDVPFRPEFKAELRHQLMAQARRTLTPWYRRTAVWGSGMAVAAAAAVLVVGLQLSGTGPAPGPAEVHPPESIVQIPPQQFVPFQVSRKTEVPVVVLADEVLPPDAAVPALPVPDVSQGLKVMQLTGRPDQRQFADLSARLGFGRTVTEAAGSFRVDEGPRSLQLTVQGLVLYRDARVNVQAGPQPGADAARAAARAFLEQAALPVPELNPPVTADGRVVYTPRVAGLPVINGRTVVRVGPGGVAEASAYVQSGVTEYETAQGVPQADAVTAAAARGGSFSGADLVWVRTEVDQGAFLQPYWRVFGTSQQGERIARYVPALSR